MIYFEDLVIGVEREFGHYDVTREEVLEFARKYDPQPFHLSDEEAAKTHFGRIAASGWHTAAMTMSVIVGRMKVEPQTRYDYGARQIGAARRVLVDLGRVLAAYFKDSIVVGNLSSAISGHCESETGHRYASEPTFCIRFEKNVLAFGKQVDR